MWKVTNCGNHSCPLNLITAVRFLRFFLNTWSQPLSIPIAQRKDSGVFMEHNCSSASLVQRLGWSRSSLSLSLFLLFAPTKQCTCYTSSYHGCGWKHLKIWILCIFWIRIMPLEKVEELTDLTKYEPNRYSMFVFQHGSQAILSPCKQCLWWKSQRLSKLITWTTRGHWNEFLKDSFCTHGSRRNVLQNCGKVNYA